MPGKIRVTVLEAVGLPARDNIGSREFVSVKVSLGEQEFVTRHKSLRDGRTAAWNSDFSFPVLNLTDKLVVAICDPEGEIKSRIAIDVSTILQAGSRDEFAPLDAGGHIHLKLSYVLTNEERKRLQAMRALTENKQYRKRRDDMRRAYDFKRKEDQCVNNGLRTVAESQEVHAGQPLDNWEILTAKKGKEVPSAELFALPLPQPIQSQSKRLVSPEAAQAESFQPSEHEHRPNGQSSRKSLELHSPRMAKQVSDSCLTRIPEGEQQDVSSSLNKFKTLEACYGWSTDVTITELGCDPLLYKVLAPPVAPKDSLSQNSGERENISECLSLDNAVVTEIKPHFDVCLPEMEKCVEVPGRFQDPMSRGGRERSSSSLKKKTQANILSHRSMDATSAVSASASQAEGTATGAATASVSIQDLRPIGDMGIASKGLQSLHVLPAAPAAEAQKPSIKTKFQQNGKEFLQQSQAREVNLPHRMGDGKLLAPMLNDGDTNVVPRPIEDENGEQQQDDGLRPSTPLKVGRSSRSLSLPVRVKTNAYLSPEKLLNYSTSSESAPETPAPMDNGWICVEHPPPMTWEDALKVAQKAKDAALAGKSPRIPPPGFSAGVPLHGSFRNTSPSSSSKFPGRNAQVRQAGQGTLLSKLPLPPDQSSIKRRPAATGNVRASVTDFGAQVHSGLKPSVFEAKNEIPPAESATAIPDTFISATGIEGEIMKKEDRRDVLPKELALEDPTSLSRAEPRHIAQKLKEVGNVDEMLHHCRNAGRYDDRRQGVDMDTERPRNVTMTGGCPRIPSRWRLPMLEDVNLEAVQNQLLQDSLTEKEFVYAVGCRDLAPGEEDKGSSFQDDVILGLKKERAAPIEGHDGAEEKKVVTDGSRGNQEENCKPKDLTSRNAPMRGQSQSDERERFYKEHLAISTVSSPKLETFNAQDVALSGDTRLDWKPIQACIASKRNSSLNSSAANERLQQMNAHGEWVNSYAPEHPVAEPPPQQAASVKEMSTSEEMSTSAEKGRSLAEKSFLDNDGGDPSKESDSNTISHLGGAMKQLLGGAVIFAGMLALWAKGFRSIKKYHIVKPGETLNSIAPGQCNNPSSNFCRINPRICDQKTIYPGQRLRLS